MKKLCSLWVNFPLFILFFYVVPNIARDTSYYYNDFYKFRFQFPTGWTIKDGIGKNVVKKAVKGGNAIMISVADITLDTEITNSFIEEKELYDLSKLEVKNKMRNWFDSRKFSEKEFEEVATPLVSEFINSFNNDLPKPTLLQTKIIYLDNTKFVFIKFERQRRVLEFVIKDIIYSYLTIRNGYLFILGAQIPERDYYIVNPIVLKAIATFQFEDWGDETDYNVMDENESANKKQNSFEIVIIVFLIGALVLFFFGIIFRFYSKNQIDLSAKTEENSKQQKQNDDKIRAGDNEKEENIDNIELYEEVDEANLTEKEKDILYGQILGLNGVVQKKDIIKAWKNKIEKYHPDKVNHLGIEFRIFAEKKTKDLNRAYLYFKRKYKL